jgi:hypothetical protein
MDGAAELLRDQAKHLSGNVDRIVPDRKTVGTIQQQQQMIAELQGQIAQLMGVGPDGQPLPQQQGMVQGPAPKNILPDGSQVGGREGNTMSPRPNGV